MLLEGASRLFLAYFATPEQFSYYASLSQLEKRNEVSKFTPHRYLGYVPTPNYHRGANKHNRLGFRGDEFAVPKPPGVYRIVCLGGSTTYSMGVDDYTDSYPYRLQQELREEGSAPVEVINAGVPGYASVESLINFELRVLDLEPDMLIVYHGINDVHLRLVWPPSVYRGDGLASARGRSGLDAPSLLESSSLIRMLLVRAKKIEPHGSLLRILGPVPEAAYSRELLRQYEAGSYPHGVFETVPARTMLERNRPIYFERNIRGILAIARLHRVAVLLSTFGLAESGAGPAWLPPEYHSAIAEHNEMLGAIAAETQTPLVDIRALVPGSEEFYSDSYHFTEAGNRLRAKIYAEHIRPSLAPPAASRP